MRLKSVQRLIPAVLFLAATLPLASQTVPAGEEGRLPFSVGAGASSFDVDWGHGRMYGGTLWIDWHPNFAPRILDGLGLEMEARDISLDHSSSQPADFRTDTAGGGVIYSWRHFNRLRPYAKYLVSFGSIDFTTANPYFNHTTDTVTAYGAGIDAHLFGQFRVRADYEYQFWHHLNPYNNNGNGTLDPQGFTLGAVYDFRGFGRRGM